MISIIDGNTKKNRNAISLYYYYILVLQSNAKKSIAISLIIDGTANAKNRNVFINNHCYYYIGIAIVECQRRHIQI